MSVFVWFELLAEVMKNWSCTHLFKHRKCRSENALCFTLYSADGCAMYIYIYSPEDECTQCRSLRPNSPEAHASSQSRAGISCALAGAVKDGVGGLQHVPEAQPLCTFKVYAKTFRPPVTLTVLFI